MIGSWLTWWVNRPEFPERGRSEFPELTAIEFQDKPVVVTGSMKPIFEDGDASANLKASVHVAGMRTANGERLDQVFICFGGRILRGNRTAKVGSGYRAIGTPRVDDLGRYETSGRRWGIPKWELRPPTRQVVPDRGEVSFPRLEPCRIPLLRLFPGVTAEMVADVARDADAIVVEAYGSGTGPRSVREYLDSLAADGCIVAVTSEAVWGEVQVGAYATDLVAEDGRLIACRNMLAEAALAKLHYLVGKADRSRPDWREHVARLMRISIRGENGD